MFSGNGICSEFIDVVIPKKYRLTIWRSILLAMDARLDNISCITNLRLPDTEYDIIVIGDRIKFEKMDSVSNSFSVDDFVDDGDKL